MIWPTKVAALMAILEGGDVIVSDAFSICIETIATNGDRFYENNAWLEFHNKSGSEFGGGTLHKDIFELQQHKVLTQTSSGMIEVKIRESSSYYVVAGNSKMKDAEVELDIDVRDVLYDTKQSFYKCTFSNVERTFNAMSLVGNSIVLTSPAPKQGAPVEDDEWYITLSYQPRWIAYVIVTGLVTCFMMVAIQFGKWLDCFGVERHLTENDSARTPLLANKDDDGSSMGSSNESFAADDADLEEYLGDESAASNGTRRLCVICFDAKRDCFFLPCGHYVSCCQCGTV